MDWDGSRGNHKIVKMAALSGARKYGKTFVSSEATITLRDCDSKANLPDAQPSTDNGADSKVPLPLEERKASHNRLSGKGSKGGIRRKDIPNAIVNDASGKIAKISGKGKGKSASKSTGGVAGKGEGKGAGKGTSDGTGRGEGKGAGKGKRSHKDKVKLQKEKGGKGIAPAPPIEAALRQPGPDAPVILYNNGCRARDQGQLEEARRLFRLAAEKNHCKATHNLAVLLEVDSPKEACALFRSAAAKGMSEAQYALGLHLRDGVGVARSLGEATQSFQLASAQGHVKASFELGCLLEEGGPGVTLDGLPNLRAARCAFEKAATLGEDSRACVHLGRSLARSGSLLEQSQAARWYTIAAARDHPAACFELAMLHASGTCGASIDPVACDRLLTVASSSGHPLAAYHLACLKLKGVAGRGGEDKGVFPPGDVAGAASLLKQASEAGIPKATRALRALERQILAADTHAKNAAAAHQGKTGDLAESKYPMPPQATSVGSLAAAAASEAAAIDEKGDEEAAARAQAYREVHAAHAKAKAARASVRASAESKVADAKIAVAEAAARRVEDSSC